MELMYTRFDITHMLIPVLARICFAGGGITWLHVVISTQTSSTYNTNNLDENFTYRLYRSQYYHYASLTRVYIFFTVQEEYFRNNRHKNPENLRNRCNFCEHPQPRYKPHPNITLVLPEFKYLLHKKCLPGCFAVQSKTTKKMTHDGNTLKINVSITNDMECEGYSSRDVGGKSNPLKATGNTVGDSTSKSFGQGKNINKSAGPSSELRKT